MDEYSSTPEHLLLLVSKTTVDFHFGIIRIVRFENAFSVEFKYVLKIEGAYFLWECLFLAVFSYKSLAENNEQL